jgi:hypothetical protein
LAARCLLFVARGPPALGDPPFFTSSVPFDAIKGGFPPQHASLSNRGVRFVRRGSVADAGCRGNVSDFEVMTNMAVSSLESSK